MAKQFFKLIFFILMVCTQAAFSQTTVPVLVTDSGAKVALTDEYLSKFSKYSLTMETPWFKGGPQVFEGVHLSDVLKANGASEKSQLKVIAYNDYKTDVPVSDAFNFDMLLATHRNGKRMPLRDKGPLFMLYPFDKIPKLATAEYYSKSPWQIKEIHIVK